MAETIAAFPLTWPEGFPRAKQRESGQFKTQLPGALKNVKESLRLFGADSGKPITSIVISSNVTLGEDKPSDPGVAVWFTWEAMQVCIPVDRYAGVASNLQAIHHILEARRTEMRHGGLAIVRATFMGFKSLPPPPGKKPWWEVLQIDKSAELKHAEESYRLLAKKAHPDAGGSREAWDELERAITQARKERG